MRQAGEDITNRAGDGNRHAEARRGRYCVVDRPAVEGPVTWLGVRSQIGMIPRPVFMVDGRVTWVVRLVKIGADGEEQRGDVVWIARPGDLAKPGLTMAEGKVVRAG